MYVKLHMFIFSNGYPPHKMVNYYVGHELKGYFTVTNYVHSSTSILL